MSKILFFGDSITAGNRSSEEPLGNGYVSVIADMFQSDTKFEKLEVINSGVNGHTVQDLLSRYKRDVVAVSPEHVVIKIGINDAYNNFMNGTKPAHLGRYVMDYDRLLFEMKKQLPNSKIRLLTPYFICSSSEDDFYQLMSLYIYCVEALGKKHGMEVFNTQEVFDKALQFMPAATLAHDRIHPERHGHELIAGYVFDFLEATL
jgi:lysophospholipase L1-like esterase